MKTSYLKYIFALLLFGSNGIVASLIHLSSYEIVLLRTLIGSLLLIAIFFMAREKLTFYKHKTKAYSLPYRELQWEQVGYSCMRHTTRLVSALPRSLITADLSL